MSKKYFDDKKKLYQLRFTYEGKRYSIYGKTKQEAEEKKFKKLEELKQHLHLDNERITLNKFFELWFEEQAGTVKESTLWNYQKSWKQLEKHLGSRKLTKISKPMVLQMRKDMRNEYSADTVNRCTRLLSQLMKAAENDRIIPKNPCEGIKPIRTVKEPAKESNHRALNEAEIRTFFKYAEGSHYFGLFQFLLKTGCRASEALALNWFDVTAKGININKTVSRVTDKDYIVSDSPKNESSKRELPITEEVAQILKEQKKRNTILFGSSTSLIFPNARGGLANYNSVDYVIKNIIKNINAKEEGTFRPFSAHAFRHTYATESNAQGMNPQVLQVLLGHSSLDMTMDLYAHVKAEVKQAEAEKIRFAV